MGHAEIDIVFPSAQKADDGIADHTRVLATELLARGHRVRVLGAGTDLGLLDAVPYINAWPEGDLRSTDVLRGLLTRGGATTVLLQMEQFSYGSRGYNPEFSRLFGELRAAAPRTRRVLVAHETYPSPTSAGRAVMWAYQRRQIRRLARDADGVLVTCDWWAERLEGVNESLAVVPAFSNIPRIESVPADTRAALGIGLDELLVVAFGHLSALRIRLIGAAIDALDSAVRARLVYIGKDVAAAGELNINGGLVVREGASAREVSEILNAADLALSPFEGGVSGKRGSFAAFMAHEVPTVTTVGRHTDQYLRTAAAVGAFEIAEPTPKAFAAAAVRLATNHGRRSRMRTVTRAAFGYIATAQAATDAVEEIADWT